MRLPIGSSSAKWRRTAVSLSSTTCGARASSPALKPRPRTSRCPSRGGSRASRSRRRSDGCCAGGGSGRPSTVNEMLNWFPVSGRPETAPTARTPGSARSRASSASWKELQPRVVRVGRLRQRDAERERAPRVEAGVHPPQQAEAADQQARAGEQHHRERDLADHEPAAQPRPPAAQDAAAALPQRLGLAPCGSSGSRAARRTRRSSAATASRRRRARRGRRAPRRGAARPAAGARAGRPPARPRAGRPRRRPRARAAGSR